jgi:hypothetical protein
MNWTPGESADEPGARRPSGGGLGPTDAEAKTRARWNVTYLALATAVLFVAIVFPGQRSGWVIALAIVAIVVILFGLGGDQPSDPWKRRRSDNPAWDRINRACARWAPYATIAAVIAAMIQSLRS